MGLVLSAWRLVRPGANPLPPDERQAQLLLAAVTAGLLAAVLAIPIAWQRYYVPLLPLVSLWSGIGLAALARPFVRQWRDQNAPARRPPAVQP